MARKPSGPRLVDKMEGSAEAKHRLRVILETIAGKRSIGEACAELGVSEARLHEMRGQALAGALMGLEPRAAGRPKEQAVEESAVVASLKDEITELKIDLEASRIREEIAIGMPHLLKPRPEAGKKKRVMPEWLERKRDT